MNQYRLMRMFDYDPKMDFFESEDIMMDFTADSDVGAVVAVLVGYLKSREKFRVSGFDSDARRNLLGLNLVRLSDGKDEYHYLVKINGENK